MESRIKNAESEYLEVGEIGYSDTLCNRVECVEDSGEFCSDCCLRALCCDIDTVLCSAKSRPDNKDVYFKISLK